MPSIDDALNDKEMDVDSFRTQIRNAMPKCAGIIREKDGMQWAIRLIEEFYRQMEDAKLPSVRACESMNMATVGLEVLRAALKREKSIGAHYRSDSK